MKSNFPGHFFQVDENHEIWNECIFVFDANILLNLYRYSDETRELLISTLSGLKERIWIPNKVAFEYLNNRLKVFWEQQDKYEKTISEINSLQQSLENSRQHPFISKEVLSELNTSFDKAKSELGDNKSAHAERLTNDKIKERIAEIFENKVGPPDLEAEILELIEEGKQRYKSKIPPGYSDAKKDTDEDSPQGKARPYSDLIIWKNIIKKGKQENRPIIFITGDAKEDWWLKFSGKTIGPRPELIAEFKSEVGKDFYMYLPERFLSLSGEIMKKQMPREILEEIRDSRKETQKGKEAAESLRRKLDAIKERLWIEQSKELQKALITKNKHESLLAHKAELIIERSIIKDRIEEILSETKTRFPYASLGTLGDQEENEYLSLKAEYLNQEEKLSSIEAQIAKIQNNIHDPDFYFERNSPNNEQ